MQSFRRIALVGLLLTLCNFDGASAKSNSFTVLHRFNGTDGDGPAGGLALDRAGNLIGTTVLGGQYGEGVIFRISQDQVYSVVHNFSGDGDGAQPYSTLIEDASGTLFGTTSNDGSAAGTVFRSTQDGVETVLHYFSGEGDGAYPFSGVIADAAGTLYGTTFDGGNEANGTVYAIGVNGAETVLYRFCALTECSDGNYPLAGLVMDKSGNLYGTTTAGGAHHGGVLFKLSPDGIETVLYNFCSISGCSDGADPEGALIIDNAGNLFGTTEFGGVGGNGTIFELSPDGSQRVLHSFTYEDGALPSAGLIADKAGNLYGTTHDGGRGHSGTVFRLSPDGKLKVLHNFRRGKDGGIPLAPLVANKKFTILYGTAKSGGDGENGVVFSIKL